jgi:two-component system phosphate regulon sensor histidine kinase PhoR
MSLALLGVIGLQVYWINWSIRLNEEQFNKHVFAALNRVADKLQYFEEVSVIQSLSEVPGGRRGFDLFRNDLSRRGAPGVDKGSSFQDVVNAYEYVKVSQLLDSRPLAERINLDMLAKSIREEINSRGIDSEYQYGVYSRAKNSFVVVNDHYVVLDHGPRMTQGGASSLYNSNYRVALFQQDIESPGYLSFYFPNRVRLVWASVWPALVMSVLFTGGILFCFWYTILVIYRQKQLSEMKTDFINNMTHEFKTPIATISLAADNIGNPMIIGHPEKIRRFTDIIRQENRRMNNQVERVLQMALIDKQDFVLSLSEVDVHDLLRQVVDNFSVQVEKRDGTLTYAPGALNSVIEADATHLASIIHNLLDNANKYSPDRPEISLSTRNVAAGIEISVSDKGIGIGKETRKHIFDKFYRAHTGNIHDVKGFGLGLSYVKGIVTAHRGLIEVRSESGRGSCFMVTLPYRQPGRD